jgi:hypothetical protein
VWATTLFDQVVARGYERCYQTFSRKLGYMGVLSAVQPSQ